MRRVPVGVREAKRWSVEKGRRTTRMVCLCFGGLVRGMGSERNDARLEELPFESALIECVALVVLGDDEDVCAAIDVSESTSGGADEDALGLSERGMSGRQSSCEALEGLVRRKRLQFKLRSIRVSSSLQQVPARTGQYRILTEARNQRTGAALQPWSQGDQTSSK